MTRVARKPVADARLAAAVPSDVELGFHLCYGDLDGVHFIQPRDTTKMVELANFVAQRVSRPMTWIHMPVPMDRADDAFYAPVANTYVQGFEIGSEYGISRARDERIALEFMRFYAGAAAAGSTAI